MNLFSRRPACPATPYRRRPAGLAALLLLLSLLTACNPRATTPASDPQKPALHQLIRQKSGTLLVSCSRTNLTTAESIRFMLEVHAPDGALVEFPALHDAIAPFTEGSVYTEPPQRLSNGTYRHRRVWTLFPDLPGTNTLRSVTVFINQNPLSSKPIPLRVTTILPADLDSQTLKPIAPPIAHLPEQQQTRKRMGIALLLSLISIGVALLIRTIKKKKNSLPVQQPHQIARAAIEQLQQENRPPRETCHGLTLILRHYLIDRFALPLSGKTIPESLPILKQHPALRPFPELILFLEQGDALRFANVVPHTFNEEGARLIKQFITATAPEEETCA